MTAHLEGFSLARVSGYSGKDFDFYHVITQDHTLSIGWYFRVLTMHATKEGGKTQKVWLVIELGWAKYEPQP